MQFERVLRISMCRMFVQVTRDIDDCNGFKWAFLKFYLKIHQVKQENIVINRLTLTQIPQPIQSSSESVAIFESEATSMQSFPIRTTGQDFLHSCRQRFGLHLSVLTIAIRVCLSVSSAARLRDISRAGFYLMMMKKELKAKEENRKRIITLCTDKIHN